jgi:hypothetical protein
MDIATSSKRMEETMRTTLFLALGLLATTVGTGCSSAEGEEELASGESALTQLTVESARQKLLAAGHFNDGRVGCGIAITVSASRFQYTNRDCEPGSPFETIRGTFEVTPGGGRGPTLNLSPETGFAWSYSIELETVQGRESLVLTRWYGWEKLRPN